MWYDTVNNDTTKVVATVTKSSNRILVFLSKTIIILLSSSNKVWLDTLIFKLKLCKNR